MQREILIEKVDNKRLILFFTGWSTDWKILEGIEIPKGYDLICCFNYLNIDWPPINKEYDEIVVIAWSFGIAAANYILSTTNLYSYVTGLYAVNGSRWPVDDKKGITETIFEKTLINLDDRSLEKFRLRIAGGKEKFLNSKDKLVSEVAIEDLKRELKIFGLGNNFYDSKIEWDYAFISENDKIFPLNNLINAWADTPFEILEREYHYPDFQYIFNLVVKDKQNIGKRFEKHRSLYPEHAKVQNLTADKLLNLIKELNRPVYNILELGGGTGNLHKPIDILYKPSQFTIIDLTETGPNEKYKFIKGDIETVIKNIPSDSYDLVISGSTVQWLHSPAKLLKEVKRVLKKDGKFIFSTFLKGNLQEIANLTGKSLLYLRKEDWEKLVRRAELVIDDCETEIFQLKFDNVKDIFDHLKLTGVNSLSGKTNTISEIKNIMQSYPKLDDNFPLTYVTLVMSLHKS